jgi:hypothetical protein
MRHSSKGAKGVPIVASSSAKCEWPSDSPKTIHLEGNPGILMDLAHAVFDFSRKQPSGTTLFGGAWRHIVIRVA